MTDAIGYFYGDKISLVTEVQHAGNLGDARAVFTREEEEGAVNRPAFGIDAVEIAELRRIGDHRTTTKIRFEGTVTEEEHMPGVFDLSELYGLSLELDRDEAQRGSWWNMGPVPEGIRVRILECPQDREPYVYYASLGRPDNDKRFYRQ